MKYPYIVFDLETTTLALAGRKGSPFHPENYTVMPGWKNPTQHRGSFLYFKSAEESRASSWFVDMLKTTKLLVGHNIKFDIQHAMTTAEQNRTAFIDWVAAGGQVWDTQLAEYLLEGMGPEAQYLSLNEVAPRYGGNTKIDAVKELWEAGVNTYDIDPDLLRDYLIGYTDADGNEEQGDLGNTELVFKGQIARARKQGQVKSILLNTGALLYTAEAEFNGMHTDLALGLQIAEELEKELAEVKEELVSYLPGNLPFEFNWGSRQQLSALIFGGSVKYDATVPVFDDAGNQLYAKKKRRVELLDEAGEPVLFKSGKRAGEVKTKEITEDDLSKPKMRKESFLFKFEGFTEPRPEWESSTPGVYSTAAKIMEALANRDIPFLQTLTRYAALVKDLGTYFITTKDNGVQAGMLTLVTDNIIHHNLNMTSTVTGRLSSSKPNLQNLSSGAKSRVKEVFTSRYPGGKIIQSDFSSLEIYIQAILTGSANMIEDLRKGIDMHCMRVAQKSGIPYSDELVLKCKGDEKNGVPPVKEWAQARKYAKVYSFQRAYGAGIKKIADTTGMSEEEAQAFADADDERYPEINSFYETLTQSIEADKVKTGHVVAHPDFRSKAVELHRGYYRTPDNKLYSYQEQPAPKYVVERSGRWATFSPTEIRNYIVQGTGAEWAKAAMWLALKAFYRKRNFGGKALLVNQVHDACYADAAPEVAVEAAQVLHAAMESASLFMETYFGWTQPLPVPSDTTYGDSMAEENAVPGLHDGLAEVVEFVQQGIGG